MFDPALCRRALPLLELFSNNENLDLLRECFVQRDCRGVLDVGFPVRRWFGLSDCYIGNLFYEPPTDTVPARFW